MHDTLTLTENAILLIEKTYMAERACEWRDRTRDVAGPDVAWLHNSIGARALSIAKHGPEYLRPAATHWAYATPEQRKEACREVIAMALLAGRATPAAVIRECHPLCTGAGVGGDLLAETRRRTRTGPE